jgi:2-iminobutanoate/2-iminopropanoate deaminase
MIRQILLLLATTALLLAERKAIRPPSSPTAGPYSAGIVTDNFVYVSGHVGFEPNGGFVPGDVKAQTRRCLELVRKVLVEAGLDYANVVSTTLYLTDIRTLDAADEAYREAFQNPFPARIEIESPLLIPEALVEISVIAVRGDPRATISINPPNWAAPKRPISHAVSAGGTLFMSTLRPIDPATGKLVGDTIQSQTAQVMRNQQAVLATMKLNASHVTGTRVYLTDPSYAASLPAMTARAIVQMTPYEPGHLIQMHSVAMRDGGRRDTLYASEPQFTRNDIKAQTKQALESLQKQLAKNGLTFSDALDAVVYLRDARHVADMNAVYREIVKPNPPVRATVRIAPIHPDSLIQIIMTAPGPAR